MWFQKEQLAALALKMIEGWKKYCDKGDLVVIILMDLKKAFNTINYSLLLAKLETCGL